MTFAEVKERVGLGIHSSADVHWLLNAYEDLLKQTTPAYPEEESKPLVVGVAAAAIGAAETETE